VGKPSTALDGIGRLSESDGRQRDVDKMEEGLGIQGSKIDMEMRDWHEQKMPDNT
jgi:hypothetical protein